MSQQGRCINPLRRRAFGAVALLTMSTLVVAPKTAAAQQINGPPTSVTLPQIGTSVTPEGDVDGPIECGDLELPPPECAPSDVSGGGGEGVGGTDPNTGVIYPETVTIEFVYNGVLYIGTAIYVSNNVFHAAYQYSAVGWDGSGVEGGLVLSLGEAILLDATGSTDIETFWIDSE